MNFPGVLFLGWNRFPRRDEIFISFITLGDVFGSGRFLPGWKNFRRVFSASALALPQQFFDLNSVHDLAYTNNIGQNLTENLVLGLARKSP